MSDISHGENWAEGPGTLLPMGLPEIRGGGTGQRGIVHRSHRPSQSALHPHHCNPLCGSDHTLKYTHTTHKHAQTLQRGGDTTPPTQLTAPEYQGNTSGPPGLKRSHESHHPALKHKQCHQEIFGQ